MYAYNEDSASHVATAKYILPYVIGIFLLMAIGQVTAQFFPVQKLDSDTGKVTDIESTVKSHTNRRSGNKPNTALVITLDNGHSFDLMDSDTTEAQVSGLLRNGDKVTIYHPTFLYKLLCEGFVHPISQLNLGSKVIYSFDAQKREARLLIGFFFAAAVVFYLLRASWIKGTW